jgi:threonine dehydrogenase-like Zn-dependent dehydrogenase
MPPSITIDRTGGCAGHCGRTARDHVVAAGHELREVSAYHLRQGGRVGIVGVGGRRDILAAIWNRRLSITAVEFIYHVGAL